MRRFLLIVTLALSACLHVPDYAPVPKLKVELNFSPPPGFDDRPTIRTDRFRLSRELLRRLRGGGWRWSFDGGDESHRWLRARGEETPTNGDTPTGYPCVTTYVRIDMDQLRVDGLLIELPRYADVDAGLQCGFSRFAEGTDKRSSSETLFRLEIETRYFDEMLRPSHKEPLIFGDWSRSDGATVVGLSGETADLHEQFTASEFFIVRYVFEGTARRAIFRLGGFRQALLEPLPDLHPWPDFYYEYHFDPPDVDPHPVADELRFTFLGRAIAVLGEQRSSSK